MYLLIYLINMKLNHLGLRAFYETAKSENMTRASKVLGLTQSALSQRILHLEIELETTLFIREGKALLLTEAGQKLLGHCHVQERLEAEFLSNIKNEKNEFSGIVRIAGFSSILRSAIIPALAPFLRSYPNVVPEFRSYEVVELPRVLQTLAADMVVMDYELNKKGVVQLNLGQEEYVVIESLRKTRHDPIYLDHGPHDNATDLFFSKQTKATPVYRRSFMGDVYGIIDGVKEGLGSAVMSRHMIRNLDGIRIVPGYKKHLRPVTLHYYERPFYPKLLNKISDLLVENCPKFLTCN
ncbi:MAG: LysR family transcriptional regulator [Bdellovibrionota bacterium]